jgi:hypothetical protein
MTENTESVRQCHYGGRADQEQRHVDRVVRGSVEEKLNPLLDQC